MSDHTPITAHVHECVKLLNEHLHNRYGNPLAVDEQSFEALFELVDLPWDEHTEEDGLFREGYETCLLDVVGAIAQAWDLDLPREPR